MTSKFISPSRRDLLRYGSVAAGAVFAGPAIPNAFAQDYEDWASTMDFEATYRRWEAEGVRSQSNGIKRLGLAVRYRTDPERIRPFLAPPLELDPSAEVQINYFIIMNPLEGASVFNPGPTYGECDMMVSCLYQGHRCMTSLPWILDQDFGRYAGREGVMLRKKDGRLILDVREGALHASVTRQGRTMMKITAPLSREPAHPYFWFREVGWGEMRHDYRLNVDWRQGIFDEGPVELWQHFGADEGYPTDMGPAENWDRYPRAIDLSKTVLDLGDPSALDPYAELPVLEILGGSGSLGPALFPELAVPRGPQKIPGKRQRTEPNERVNLGPVPKEPMEPLAWVHKGWDPPVFAGEAYKPEGWPARGTAIALPAAVLERYKAREAIEVGPAVMVGLTLELDKALHARTIPPAFQPGGRPELVILANKVARSDVSTVPFTELWLMSACEFEGKPAWFALSNIVGWDGDVLSGRENWGYPSKLGEPSMTLGETISVHGERVHRTFLTLSLPSPQGGGEARTLDWMVMGAQPAPKGRQPAGRWVANPWQIVLNGYRSVDPASVSLALPAEEGPPVIGLTDPWCEFASGRITSAFVSEGTVRRLPARIVGPIEASAVPYLVDRRDGYNARPEKPNTSFLGPA